MNIFSKHRRTLSIIIAMLMSLTASTAWAAGVKIYKWVDDNGSVIYSQTPPPKGTEAKKIKAPPPAPVDPIEAMNTLRKRAEAFGKRRDDRLENEQKDTEASDQAKKQGDMCSKLRKNLSDMQSSAQIQVKDEDGKIRIIGEEDRQQRIKSTKGRIQKECSAS